MSKFDFEVAVAFGTQEAEGSYNDALDAISSSLSYAETPGADSQTAGLVLGDPESGVRQSGLALTLGRSRRDKAFIGSSFTRSLSDFLAAEVRTFTFAMPYCGNRADANTPPVDADATPIAGLNALLVGAGLAGGAWGAGVGWRYQFSPGNPISALVYYFGNRLELLDCRCALAIDFTPGSIPILTATIEVGSIKDHSLAALPGTLTYGEQASVTAPSIVSVANTWREARGFSTATLNIAPAFEDIPDSNSATGVVKEQTDREVTFEGTVFADDGTDKGHEYEQLTATDQATLDQLLFTVGDAMTDGNPAEAVRVVINDPEPDEATIAALGSKAAHDVRLIARGSSGDDELSLDFL